MVWPSGENRAVLTWPPRKVSRVKIGAGDFNVARPNQNAAAATTSRAGITTSKGVRKRAALVRRDPAIGLLALLTDDKLSRSNARSRADWKRRPGSFSREWRTIRSGPGG